MNDTQQGVLLSEAPNSLGSPLMPSDNASNEARWRRAKVTMVGGTLLSSASALSETRHALTQTARMVSQTSKKRCLVLRLRQSSPLAQTAWKAHLRV